MRVDICSCLLVFTLGCKVAAAIKHEIVEEKQQVLLPCPHSVEGEVLWSRETNGSRVDILTAGGDGDKKHIKETRYSSQADPFKSLYIGTVTVSDSGRYLCNNEAAVELTVIPSGTTRRNATEKTSVTLSCPHDVGGSHAPTWSKNGSKIQQKKRFSPVDKTLTIRYVQLRDSGLYYCDGKPAVYLTVMEAETSDRGKKTTTTTTTPTTTTKPSMPMKPTTMTKPTTTTKAKPTKKPPKKAKPTTTTTEKPTLTTKPATMKLTTTTSPLSNTVAPTDQPPPLHLVIGIVVPSLLILLLIFIFIQRRRVKRRGTEERYHVYDEIQGGSVFQAAHGVERVPVPVDAYCMAEFPGGSDQNDPTYSTIPDLLPMEKTTADESPYSVICETFPGGNNNKGSSQPMGDTYSLLQNPKTPGKQLK